jgi:hypothetical protein
MQDVDPRLVKLVQQLDDERRRRTKAERQAVGLRAVLTRLQRERQRTADAKLTREDQQHAGC